MKYLLFWAGVALVSISRPALGAVAGVVVTVAYVYSLHRRPMRPCRTCGGSGANRGVFWKYAFGECWCCHGSKSHARLGIRVLQRNRYRQISQR